MAVTTPALAFMNTEMLSPEAYAHADIVLLQEGIDPLTAFTDQETQRHHYAVATSFQADAERLRTLAIAAYTDRTLGTTALQSIDATEAERIIAANFDADPTRVFVSLSSIYTYLTQLHQLQKGMPL